MSEKEKNYSKEIIIIVGGSLLLLFLLSKGEKTEKQIKDIIEKPKKAKTIFLPAKFEKNYLGEFNLIIQNMSFNLKEISGRQGFKNYLLNLRKKELSNIRYIIKLIIKGDEFSGDVDNFNTLCERNGIICESNVY